MLIIREPIKLKNRDIVTSSDAFSLALFENYEKKDATFSANELMHLITTPPEIVYAEGNETNFFTSNLRIENITEQRVEILNSLINRIMITAEGKLSYRDRVYISGYLTKLGITNQQMFMKNVKEVLSEHQTSIKTLSSLREKLEYVSAIYPEVIERLEKKAKVSVKAQDKETEKLFLHEHIFERLETAKIYDTLWKYKENNSHSERISSGELRIAEQHKNSRYMELNGLQTKILGTALPLEFYHQDVYEQQLMESLQSLTEEEITQNLMQASLLSIIEKVYESRATHINEHKRIVLEVKDLYNTVENTFERYVENIYSPQIHSTVYNTEISQVASQVLEFFEMQSMVPEPEAELGDEPLSKSIERIEKTNAKTRDRYILALKQLERNLSAKADAAEAPMIIKQVLNVLEGQAVPVQQAPKIVEETIRRYFERVEKTNEKTRDNYILTLQQLERGVTTEKENTEVTQVINQVLNYLEEQAIPAAQRPGLAEATIRRYFARVENANVENRNRYILAMQRLERNLTIESSNAEISTVTNQVLNFLEQPRSKEQESENIPEIINQVLSYLEEQSIVIEQKPEYVETIISRNVERIEKTNVETQNRYIMAMQQLEKRLHSERAVMPTAADRRAESLEALRNPTELLHRYETEHTERIEKQEQIKAETLRQMSPATQKYVELIERFIINPTPQDRVLMESTDPFSSLVKDIQAVERVLTKKEETVSEINDQDINLVRETIKKVKGETEYIENNVSNNVVLKKTAMVHKVTETINEEEILERIDEIRNMAKETTRVVNESEQTRVVRNNIRTTEQVTENIDQNKIKEMVRSQVAGQVGELSEQVFRRLENKLANEKRRRGY